MVAPLFKPGHLRSFKSMIERAGAKAAGLPHVQL
jgi:hypothetical protein